MNALPGTYSASKSKGAALKTGVGTGTGSRTGSAIGTGTALHSKDNLVVIKELADCLRTTVHLNPLPREFKTSSKPFEYEVVFDDEVLSHGEGDSIRKAQQLGATKALDILTQNGHRRTIGLLQRFGHRGHCEVDRNLFVEITRERTDNPLYAVESAQELPSHLCVHPRVRRSVLIDDAPELESYKTRVLGISQIDEPAVLGCLEVAGPLQFSIVSGIFHRDVHRGRYGYHEPETCSDGNLYGNGLENKSRGKRSSRRRKKKKKAIKSRRKWSKSTEIVSALTTETGTNTNHNNDKSVDTADSIHSQFPTMADEERAVSGDTVPERLVMTLPTESDTASKRRMSFHSDHSGSTEHNAPHRRHSDGSAIPGHSRSFHGLRRQHRLNDKRGHGRRGRHTYCHPSKYQHHEIYSSDFGSPQVHKHSKRRQRRHQHSLAVHHDAAERVKVTELCLLENGLCSLCGSYFGDGAKGQSLMTHSGQSQGDCTDCIQNGKSGQKREKVENFKNVKNVKCSTDQLENSSVEMLAISSPPMTPPSTDEEPVPDANGSTVSSDDDDDAADSNVDPTVASKVTNSSMEMLQEMLGVALAEIEVVPTSSSPSDDRNGSEDEAEDDEEHEVETERMNTVSTATQVNSGNVNDIANKATQVTNGVHLRECNGQFPNHVNRHNFSFHSFPQHRFSTISAPSISQNTYVDTPCDRTAESNWTSFGPIGEMQHYGSNVHRPRHERMHHNPSFSAQTNSFNDFNPFAPFQCTYPSVYPSV